MRDLSPEDAWALYLAQAPFLDARRHDAYLQGHIPGAWSIPVWEAGADARITAFEAARAVASTAPLALYCDGGDCQDSHLLASRLVALGYRNLFIYQAGYPDWVKLGRATRQGDQP